MDAVVVAAQQTKFLAKAKMTSVDDLLTNADNYYMVLFKNNVQVTYLTTLADLAECDFSGYARSDLPTKIGTFVGGGQRVFNDYGPGVFLHNGGAVSNTAYSVGLVTTNDGVGATATASQTAGVITGTVITAAGTKYEAAPKITVSDAGPGAGAVIEATITSGTISALTIVDGGAGYTTITIDIQPPENLWMAQNLDTPKAFSSLDDGLPVLMSFPDQGPNGPTA